MFTKTCTHHSEHTVKEKQQREKVEQALLPLGGRFTNLRCKAFLHMLELAQQPERVLGRALAHHNPAPPPADFG